MKFFVVIMLCYYVVLYVSDVWFEIINKNPFKNQII